MKQNMKKREEISRNNSPQAQVRCRAVIIGLGDGGCHAVAHIARHWKDVPELIAINTDISQTPNPKNIRCVEIGRDVMKGMGTGGDPRVGRRAAESDMDTIRELFTEKDMAFLIVGLGGGTGTGAAPLIIEEARKAGALTLCFAMLPFEFEGKQRMEHANRGLSALQEVADAVICIPNQRLFKLIEKRANITKVFRKTDEVLNKGVRAIWHELCREGGFQGINLDFSDLRTLVKNGTGRCVFGYSEGTGADKVELVIKGIRNHPLLNQGQVMANAYSFLVSIVGGPDMSLQTVDQIMTGILEIARKDALIKTGVGCDPDWKDKVSVMILVSEKEKVPEAGHPPRTEKEDILDETEEHINKQTDRSKPARKKKLMQANLFQTWGRFKEVDPTIVDGSNLDIPTYIRRGILIQKTKDDAL